MKGESRKYILTSKFTQGTLSECEEVELFEMLEQNGELDGFLAGEIKLTPQSDIIYEDKEFLKSIAEPIVELTADETILYPHKNILYRRSLTTSNIEKSLRYVAAIAALIICGLYLHPDSNMVEKAIVDKLALSKQINSIELKLFTPEKVELREIRPTTQKHITQHKNSRVAQVEPPKGDTEVVINSVAKKVVSTATYTSNMKESKLASTTQTLTSDVTLDQSIDEINSNIHTNEIKLFAESESWSSSNDISEMEIVIEQEEWVPSRRNIRERIVDRLDQSNININ